MAVARPLLGLDLFPTSFLDVVVSVSVEDFDPWVAVQFFLRARQEIAEHSLEGKAAQMDAVFPYSGSLAGQLEEGIISLKEGMLRHNLESGLEKLGLKISSPFSPGTFAETNERFMRMFDAEKFLQFLAAVRRDGLADTRSDSGSFVEAVEEFAGELVGEIRRAARAECSDDSVDEVLKHAADLADGFESIRGEESSDSIACQQLRALGKANEGRYLREYVFANYLGVSDLPLPENHAPAGWHRDLTLTADDLDTLWKQVSKVITDAARKGEKGKEFAKGVVDESKRQLASSMEDLADGEDPDKASKHTVLVIHKGNLERLGKSLDPPTNGLSNC